MKALLVFAALASFACANDLARYVNPFVGTSYTGHTHPAACVPFGLVAAGPDTGNGSWDYCSGYRYEDKKIDCFSQTHFSGTGCEDLGDVALMPFTGDPQAYSSVQDKSQEIAEPGYYATMLSDFGVKVEATATERVALYRFAYPAENNAKVLLDLQHGIVHKTDMLPKRVRENTVSLSGDDTIEGYSYCKAWLWRDVYFTVKFDHKWKTIRELPRPDIEKGPKYVLEFDLKPGENLLAKISVANSDAEGPRANIASELPDWNFDSTRKNARDKWNRLLARMEVLDGTDEQKANFYTSLYHLFLQPSNLADARGFVRGPSGKLFKADNGRFDTSFSLWDTFRAAHPLYTIVTPELVDGFCSSMFQHYKDFGALPIICYWGRETYCMIGVHSIPVLVDAFEKGFAVDKDLLAEALNATLRKHHKGFPKENWDLLDRYGYYPFDKIKGESVSRLLEICYDDWCAAKFLRKIGKTADAEYFEKRSQNWTNVFDKSTGFMRGRDTNGNWREPFDPFSLGHGAGTANDFTEGNSWQYTWHVMQEPEKFISLFGGKEAFVNKLGQLFKQPEKTEGSGFVSDVTGLIGQYAHGNEPSHHTIYFFQYANRPDKTAELVREVFDKFYLNKPDGLCGNDDCGQMSAWYLFSAMGFYPFNPCGDGYVLGAPQIAKTRINLPSGKTFTVTAKGLSKDNKYVKSATLNGKPLQGFKLSHEQLINGGELVFEMTSRK